MLVGMSVAGAVGVLEGVPVGGLVGVSVGMSVAGGEQGLVGEAVLRGLGGWAVKSAALSSVSLQPPPLRVAALVALVAGALPLPS